MGLFSRIFRRRYRLEASDAALIFRENGSVEAVLPQMDMDNTVPEHCQTATAWMLAIHDDAVCEQVREMWRDAVESTKEPVEGSPDKVEGE